MDKWDTIAPLISSLAQKEKDKENEMEKWDTLPPLNSSLSEKEIPLPEAARASRLGVGRVAYHNIYHDSDDSSWSNSSISFETRRRDQSGDNDD